MFKVSSFKKIAQNYQLTINNLRDMIQWSKSNRDVPGQQYLINGPDMRELQTLRNTNTEKLIQAQSMFQDIFVILGDNIKDEYNWQSPIIEDESIIQDNIEELVNIFASDYKFKSISDQLDFISNFNEEEIKSTLKEYLETTFYKKTLKKFDVTEFNAQIEHPGFHKLLEHKEDLMGHDENGFAFNDIINNYQKYIETDDDIYKDASLNTLTTLSYDVLEEILEEYSDADANRYTRRRLENEVPSWIFDDFIYLCKENFEDSFKSWLENNEDDQFRQIAIEQIHESVIENYNDISRQLEHRFGFDVLYIIAKKYDKTKLNDERNDISILNISNILDILVENSAVYGSTGDVILPSMYIVFTIISLLNEDPVLKQIFANDMSSIDLKENLINKGLDHLISDYSDLTLYGPVGGKLLAQRDEINKKIIEQQQEIERVRKLEDSILPRIKRKITPEELEKFRQLGISTKPFDHNIILDRGNFPGIGNFNSKAQNSNMRSFYIAIEPNTDKVPQKLLGEMNLHNLTYNINSNKPQVYLGWIGGFVDISEKIMYITEVQSDVMQRTVQMSNPEIRKKEYDKTINDLQTKINHLQQFVNTGYNPRTKLEATIQRIESELGHYPVNSQEHIKRTDLLVNLRQQLNNAPDFKNTQQIQWQIQKLQEQIKQKTDEFNYERHSGYKKDFSHWHKYRSIVEKTFHDWIAIFFNAAMRVAKDNKYEKVMIISSDELMKIWADFTRPETKQLFERVYDNVAGFYGGKKVNINNEDWFEVDMQDPLLRIANWLTRLVKISQLNEQPSHEWFTVIPNTSGKQMWQIHLDKYIEVMQRKMPEFFTSDYETIDIDNYKYTEGMQAIYNLWLEEVPNELKAGDDLDPMFKEMVQTYLEFEYQFHLDTTDSFNDESDDTRIPSAEELDDWWS